MRWRTARLAALVASAALVAAGCSGSTPGGGSGGGGSGDGGRGPFTVARGKDTSGKFDEVIKLWNKTHPKQKAKLIELPESADAQRSAMVQNLQAKSNRFDVLMTDVIWTAEFAARGWVIPLDKSKYPLDEMLEGPVKTGMYQGKLYALPYNSNGGLLFYNTQVTKQPPKTWSEMIDMCKSMQQKMGCYTGQFAKYEGLTVNVSEAIHSAGGRILSENGEKVLIDSPEARQGLQFLVDGFQQGYIPEAAITYKEEEGRRAFQSERLAFLRNWPYVYGLATEEGSEVKGHFEIAPLPGLNGTGVSTLGGYNLAISQFSDAKKSAKEFLQFMVTKKVQRMELTEMAHAPVLASLYDDPKLVEQFAYLQTLKKSIATAEPRPVTPYYNEISLAIQKHAYAALQGEKSVDQAITDLEAELKRIVAQS